MAANAAAFSKAIGLTQVDVVGFRSAAQSRRNGRWPSPNSCAA